MAINCLLRSLNSMQQSPYTEFIAWPIDDTDVFNWEAIIFGMKGTPFEDGLFRLLIHFPKDYPLSAPKMNFITPIYHPNIDDEGRLCLDILKDQYSPGLSIMKILLCVHSNLNYPELDDPLMPEIAHIYKTDKKRFDDTAKEWTKRFA